MYCLIQIFIAWSRQYIEMHLFTDLSVYLDRKCHEDKTLNKIMYGFQKSVQDFPGTLNIRYVLIIT